jgi:hypothetical protein
MGSRDRSTQNSSIFPPSGKIPAKDKIFDKQLIHRLGIRALHGPALSLNLSIAPQHYEVEFGLTHKANFSYASSLKASPYQHQP